MLDTIKLGIPLSKQQFNRIQEIAYATDREQWALFNPTTGELRLRRVGGLATTDQHSFHREIRWDTPSSYIRDETYLTVELSLPKLWYGHNIHLLYGFVAAIAHLKSLLEEQFKLKRHKLADVMSWQIWRVDCCYAWRMLSQPVAQQYLDSLKHLHYPRKKPIIYPTSIVFAGATYTVKFYLKLPEFKQHDLKTLLKARASKQWIDHLESQADGVLRYEATLRRKYLERQNVKTVEDISRPLRQLVWDKSCSYEGFNPYVSMVAINTYQMSQGLDPTTELKDGLTLTAPELEFEFNGHILRHGGGGYTVRVKDNPTAVLQYFLTKLIGDNVGMQHIDEVEAKLIAIYKPVKAARLVSMWLYVQRLGTAKAKEAFGRDPYYRAKRDLKAAGVSMIETPENVTTIDSDFYRAFRMQVPSPYVTNKFDDFRDSDNLLNFVPKSSIS